MADGADRAFDRMDKTFDQKMRPLLNELKGDPLKVNRAIAGDLGDASDLFSLIGNTGALKTSLMPDLEVGKGEWAAGSRRPTLSCRPAASATAFYLIGFAGRKPGA